MVKILSISFHSSEFTTFVISRAMSLCCCIFLFVWNQNVHKTQNKNMKLLQSLYGLMDSVLYSRGSYVSHWILFARYFSVISSVKR